MDCTSVVRTNTGHVFVGQRCFRLRDLGNAAYRKVVDAGSSNPAYDLPPFFWTGSPYGEAILLLNCAQVDPPSHWLIEHVPRGSRRPWKSHRPIWPEVFGVDPDLYFNPYGD